MDKNTEQVTKKTGGLQGHQIYEKKKKLNFTDYQISTNENDIKILLYEISSNYKD